MTPTRITILLTDGTDHLVLEFPFMTGCWPYTETASAIMHVAADFGLTYAQRHFPGIPIEVRDVRAVHR